MVPSQTTTETGKTGESTQLSNSVGGGFTPNEFPLGHVKFGMSTVQVDRSPRQEAKKLGDEVQH